MNKAQLNKNYFLETNNEYISPFIKKNWFYINHPDVIITGFNDYPYWGLSTDSNLSEFLIIKRKLQLVLKIKLKK